MKSKNKVKIIITVVAATLAALHIIFPQIEIDMNTMILLGIAILPWLDSVFRSVSLPGGVGFTFQDLEQAGFYAQRAGLLTTNQSEQGFETAVIKPDYDFVEIAENNPGLAMLTLRVEIEKRLRALAANHTIDSKKYSVLQLTDILAGKNFLSGAEAAALKKLIITLDQGSEAAMQDPRITRWVMDNGPAIISNLENKK